MASRQKLVVGRARPEDMQIALSRLHTEINCEGCTAEWEELIRDKRDAEDIDCGTWDSETCQVLLGGKGRTAVYCEGGPGCHCHHLSEPHRDKKGKPWCPGGQHAHDPKVHGKELCGFMSKAEYAAQRGCPSAQIMVEEEPVEVVLSPNIAVKDVQFNPQQQMVRVEICPTYYTSHRARHGECRCDPPPNPDDPNPNHRFYNYGNITDQGALESAVDTAIHAAQTAFGPAEPLKVDQLVGKRAS